MAPWTLSAWANVTAWEAVDVSAMARMRAYLDFAATYPKRLCGDVLDALRAALRRQCPRTLSQAFSTIRAAFPGPDDTRAEVAWSTLHGLATLQSSGRLPQSRMQARLGRAHQMLTQS